LIRDGYFADGNRELFKPITDQLLQSDYYRVMADYTAYAKTQQDVDMNYKDHQNWIQKSIYNCANMGKFSSDRTIRAYADDIWKVKNTPIRLKKEN